MAPTNDDLVKRNEEYASTHQPMPTIDEIAQMGGGPPTTAIITCADPRVLPEQLLGLKVGEALIFRTIAGHPHAALEDLATLDIEFKGSIQEVMIIYHTDCGSLRFDVPKIQSEWVERDATYEGRVEQMTFGAVDRSAVDQSIHKDVKWLKEQPLMRKGVGLTVKGYLYDIKTGKLRWVA